MPESIHRQQVSGKTFQGRHVHIMDTAKKLTDSDTPNILSFGCSSGEECLDLAEVFPDSPITGVDISDIALAKAAKIDHPHITIMRSTEENLRRQGPFDIIFAMNVLCLFPAANRVSDISKLYPFSQFEDCLAIIDRHLKVGGVLSLFNASYFFDDSVIFSRYEPLAQGQPPASAFSNRFRPDGKQATTRTIIFEGVEMSKAEWTALRKLRPDIKAKGYREDWTDPNTYSGRTKNVTLWRKIS